MEKQEERFRAVEYDRYMTKTAMCLAGVCFAIMSWFTVINGILNGRTGHRGYMTMMIPCLGTD